MTCVPDCRWRTVRRDEHRWAPAGSTAFGRNLTQGKRYLTFRIGEGDVAVLRSDGHWDRGWLIGNFEEPS